MTKKAKQPAQGLFRPIGAISLFSIITLIVAAIYFFTAPAIKYFIVTSAQSATGAETNVEEVNVTWSPFSIEIIGFQQTDPNQPSHNMVQFERTVASIELFELILGKTIIEELAVENLTYSVKRQSEGELFTNTEVESSDDTEKAPETSTSEKDNSISIPSADELLKDADLLTVEKGQQLKQVWSTEQQALNQVYKNLPNEKALAKYDEQWREIEKTKIKSLDDLKKLKAKVKALEADVKKDKDALSTAKKQYKQSKTKIDTAYKELKEAPAKDWQMIEEKLPIQDPNAMAISQLLFGEEITGYLDSANTYWQTAKPYIDAYRANKKAEQTVDPKSGEDITFGLNVVYPDFLIKRAVMSIYKQTDDNNFKFKLLGNDITHQNHIINKPSELTLTLVDKQTNSDRQPFIANVDIYTDENMQSNINGDWSLANNTINNEQLLNENDLSLTLESAKLDGQGTFSYQNELASQHQFMFKQTRFTGKGDSELANLTLESLTPVESFDLLIELSGELKKPDTKITSNLDNQLKNAFKQSVGNRFDEVKTDTKAKLQDELQTQLNLNSEDMDKFKQWENKWNEAESKLKKYNKESLQKLIDEKTDEQKDKAKDKIKEKLKGLF